MFLEFEKLYFRKIYNSKYPNSVILEKETSKVS